MYFVFTILLVLPLFNIAYWILITDYSSLIDMKPKMLLKLILSLF